MTAENFKYPFKKGVRGLKICLFFILNKLINSLKLLVLLYRFRRLFRGLVNVKFKKTEFYILFYENPFEYMSNVLFKSN